MKLFPHVLVRIGGGTFDHLEKMDFAPLSRQSDELRQRGEEKESHKARLSERLLAYIRQATDSRAQNALQNVRRDLFNDRSVKPAVLAEVRQLLPPGLGRELDEYLAATARIGELKEAFRQTYERHVLRARRQLQGLADDENLRKGLVLSSQSLLDSLAAYRQKDAGAFRKKEFQTEYSLLRYLTRMYVKTSPFSTFNNLALGRLSPAAAPLRLEAGEGSPVRGHIRLNNQLFKYLKDLFAAYREVYLRLPLRPNPTLAGKGSHFLYLTNHNNVEAFQRIPASPEVSLMGQLAGQLPAGIRFDALVAEMQEYIDASAEELEAYVKQLVAYGFFEYDLGVSGIDPDWDLKLVEKLQPLVDEGVPHLEALTRCLRHVRQLAGQYAAAGVPERKALLNETYETLRAVCMQLHEAAGLPANERRTREEWVAERRARQQEQERKQQTGPAEPEAAVAVAEEETGPAEEEAFKHQSVTFFAFKPEQMFYEDTTRAVTARFSEADLHAWVGQVDTLLGELLPFRSYRDEQDLMQHFFLERYGDHAPVDLLTFYEEYYREVKKPEAERQAQQRRQAAEAFKNPPPAKGVAGGPAAEAPPPVAAESPAAGPEVIPAVARRQAQVKAWHEQYVARLRPLLTPGGTGPVHLRLAEVQQANAAAGNAPAARGANSYGMFVQFFQEPDATGRLQLKGVLNGTFGGYGKMLSRFLHILDPQVTEDVRQWNGRLAGADSLLIENCDASYFNANLHPPLLPYEIRTPGGHHALPAERQLPITDFAVQYDPAQHEIRLVHKPTARPAYVFDLGFQGLNGRSQLFQLLEKFTPVEYLSPRPVVNAVDYILHPPAEGNAQAALTEVVVLPRVVYEDAVILRRKSWHIPKERLPVRQPHENDAAYFQVVSEWRQRLDLPAEVFIFVNPNRDHDQAALPEQFRKVGRDDYKPQYIHFENPLLVNLFERLVDKVPQVLKIEEMLPHSGHLATIGGEKFVTEYVVQWYTEGGN